MALKTIRTLDGSPTLFNEDLNETYHSAHGALAESEHVFIQAGLRPLLAKKTDITLLEVGFGTGLNALLTYRDVRDASARVHYTALEPDPIPFETAMALAYPALLNDAELQVAYERLHASPHNQTTAISNFFLLHNWQARIQDIDLALRYDLVYFDAFAPNKQPEMWTADVFAKIAAAQASDGVLVTYCAKGDVKRALKASGYCVEALPGAPGKREMIRAIMI